MKAQRTITFSSTLLAAFLILALGLPAQAARAPVGKTYFVISLGVATDTSQAYEVAVGCIRFTGDQICDASGECTGSWSRVPDPERPRQQWEIAFRFELVDDETGLPVEVEGRGRVDSRGARSAIGGVARGYRPDSQTELNFALAGRSVGPERCRELAEEQAPEN